MKNSKTNWNLLLESNKSVSELIRNWASGDFSTRNVADTLSFTEFAGEFRRLVRSRGTVLGRKMARKALKQRGVSI